METGHLKIEFNVFTTDIIYILYFNNVVVRFIKDKDKLYCMSRYNDGDMNGADIVGVDEI